MKEGTKSVLFGAHSIVHTVCVILAWRAVYGVWPRWRTCVCIALHDIGYWGTDYLSQKSNEGHAELGARVAHRLFGPAYAELVLGHSSSAQKKYNLRPSLLEKPDDYSWLIAPLWWRRWNNWLEGFGIDPEVWADDVRKRLAGKIKASGTERLHALRGSK